MVNSAGGRLPAEFKELAYIEGTGTQYINTGVTLNQDDDIRLVLMFISFGDIPNVFGCRASASSKNISCLWDSTNGLVIDFNNSNYSTYRLTTAIDANKKYTLYITKARRAVYYGSTLVKEVTTAEQSTFTTGNALLFFVGGTVPRTTKFSGRVYELEIAGKCHLIPAKRKADDVVGMYDLVSGSFMTNAGSGSFGYGGVVVAMS